MEPKDTSVVLGHSVTFNAQATGFPMPIIRWKRATLDGQSNTFRVVISNANVQTLENGSLVIREALRTDTGRYMCQALNGVGPGISTVIKLAVHGE